MTSIDRMFFKIMWGLTMRCLFLILRLHNNNATAIVAEYKALVVPNGPFDRWGVEELPDDELLDKPQ